MIVSVAMRVTADDGLPMLLYEGGEMVLQTDFEGNLAKACMKLDELTEAGSKAMQRQVRAYRDNPPPPPDD